MRLVLKGVEVLVQMESALDLEAERKRLKLEAKAVKAQVDRLEARLADKVFLAKAPQAVVAKERQRLAEAKNKLERLKQSLD